MGEPSQQQGLWFWRDSCINVANNSDYKVSYWVEQECKMKTRAVQETVVSTMDTKLNGKASIGDDGDRGEDGDGGGGGGGIVSAMMGGGGGGGPGAEVRAAKRAKTEKTVCTEKTEMVSYFLMKDHRMEPRRGTPPTTVYFPEGCKNLRVYAFFQAKDGQTWKSYKDKVYSVNGRKREYTLTALNANIKPYI
ncbi:unnamed protein product [Ectocarpus sp. 6 AP-2014]